MTPIEKKMLIALAILFVALTSGCNSKIQEVGEAGMSLGYKCAEFGYTLEECKKRAGYLP